MSDNLPPGAAWYLAQEERAADAYDRAVEKAWQVLCEEAPEGLAWDITHKQSLPSGAFEFVFTDTGGYAYTATIELWSYSDDL